MFDPEGPNRAFAIPNLSITYRARKEETIEVPAGTFQAIPVDSSRAVGPPFTGTTWYAPGIGVVKAVTNFGGRERTTVLKSFSPGR
ncbi:TapB family protein [Limnoglobus roseus]|uniref:TapB family protein n=1 Tax=Limnoglobus roseus TaxID=2598579 RepID=UPI0011EB89A6|nr:hypothetical protein [Limnoglobus roseus]